MKNEQNPTRRSFLKKIGTGLAGLVLTGSPISYSLFSSKKSIAEDFPDPLSQLIFLNLER